MPSVVAPKLTNTRFKIDSDTCVVKLLTDLLSERISNYALVGLGRARSAYASLALVKAHAMPDTSTSRPSILRPVAVDFAARGVGGSAQLAASSPPSFDEARLAELELDEEPLSSELKCLAGALAQRHTTVLISCVCVL